MNEEYIFDIDKISLSNLFRLESDAADTAELRACEIAFIADSVVTKSLELIDGGMTIDDILAVLSDEFSSLFAPKECVLSETVIDVSSQLSAFSDLDKAVFSEILVKKLEENDIYITESIFLETAHTDEMFTYVKNSLSDEAYDVFSQEFNDPRVSYSESFREACFAVANGQVGYCILPFEERGGMRIPGIYSMISKLDLKIVSVTPVFGPEGTSDMKYALVGRGFSIPEIDDDVDRYLEIRLSTEESLESFLSIAKYFKLSIYRINTMYSDSPDGSSSFYSVVLKDGGRTFSSFLVFLTVFMRNYTPLGIYKNLE